ncbi:MAG TPA: hypothetical protein VGI39_36450 [Polyangiaceae bacterium]|jgi:hypothetical protein
MSEFDDLYRAPQATAALAKGTVPGSPLKWVFAGLVAAGEGAGLLSGFWKPAEALAIVLAVGAHLVGLAWLDRAWREVRRGNKAMILEGMSARTPLRGLFIPFYNLYWGFAVHSRLNGALEASLRQRNLGLEVEPGWAYAAMAGLVLARLLQGAQSSAPAALTFVLSDVLWFIYMSRFDKLRRMVALADLAEGENGAKRPSPSPA